GAAGTVWAVPSDRVRSMAPVVVAGRTVTIAPTSEPVPVTRKSPDFHLAVPMLTVSVTRVGTSGPYGVDSGPKPATFFALTVKKYSVPGDRLWIVTVFAVMPGIVLTLT